MRLRGSFCSKWGGVCAPPPPYDPPACFEHFMRATMNSMSLLRLQQWRVLRIILFAANGESAGPPPRGVFQQSMLAVKSIMSLLCL